MRYGHAKFFSMLPALHAEVKLSARYARDFNGE
jgi:hypothetical protein